MLLLNSVCVMCVMIVGFDIRFGEVGLFILYDMWIMFIEFLIVMFCVMLFCRLILVWLSVGRISVLWLWIR